MRHRYTGRMWVAGLIAASWTHHAFAQAQGVSEEILGVDPARNVVTYVERSPTPVATFAHVTIVEVASDGTTRRIRLTTDEDVAQMRNIRDGGSPRAAIEARVRHDIDAARGRLRPASVLPASQPLSGSACTRAPFSPSEASLPDNLAIRVEPAADGASTRLTMTRNGRGAAPVDVPSVTLTQGSTVVRAPYDRIADVRELPGGDSFALLLRSDACTPEGQAVPVTLVRIAAPPFPESALQPLTHAELPEAEVIRAIAPRARRRTVDETSGWYDRNARVVFDNAWSLPASMGPDRVLVQFTRVEADMPPPVVEAGQANAQFALFTHARGHLRLLAQLAPPVRDNVFEGSGQEAFTADLDGNGRPEVVIRTRYNPDSEIASVLQVNDDSMLFVWRGQTMLDERTTQTAMNPAWRRCDLGVDGTTLVLRCRTAVYRPNARGADAPISTGQLVQRLRWNGGVATVEEERR